MKSLCMSYLVISIITISGPFSYARIIGSRQINCNSKDNKIKVSINLSKSNAKIVINKKEEKDSLQLTFPVCVKESDWFRFAQPSDKGYSLVFNSKENKVKIYQGGNLDCNLKPLSELKCK